MLFFPLRLLQKCGLVDRQSIPVTSGQLGAGPQTALLFSDETSCKAAVCGPPGMSWLECFLGIELVVSVADMHS